MTKPVVTKPVMIALGILLLTACDSEVAPLDNSPQTAPPIAPVESPTAPPVDDGKQQGELERAKARLELQAKREREAIARLESLETKLDEAGIAFKVELNSVKFSSMPNLAEKKIDAFEYITLLSTYYKAIGDELRSGDIIDAKMVSEYKLKQQLIFKVGAPEMKRLGENAPHAIANKHPGVVMEDEDWIWNPETFESTFDPKQADDLVSHLRVVVELLEESTEFFDLKLLVTSDALRMEGQAGNRYGGFGVLGREDKTFLSEHGDLLNGVFAHTVRAKVDRIKALLSAVKEPVTKEALQSVNAKLARKSLETAIIEREKRLEALGWKIALENGKPTIDEVARKNYERKHRFDRQSPLSLQLEAGAVIYLYSELYFALTYTKETDVDVVRKLLEEKHAVVLDALARNRNFEGEGEKLDGLLEKAADEQLKKPLSERRSKPYTLKGL